MADIIGSLSMAVSVVSRLMTINDNIKNAEFSNLLAQLSTDLSQGA